MKPQSVILLSILSILFFSCKPEEIPDPPSGLEDAAKIQIWSGNAQSVVIRQSLDEPLVVQVLSDLGEGVIDVPVSFRILSGGGSVSDSLVVTNEEGLAQVNWTMGDSASIDSSFQLMAEIDISFNNHVIFDATANAFGVSATMTDSRDGKIYGTTQIGNQIWLAENLRYNLSGSFQNPQNPGIVYGYLYSWDQARNACPTGWHLPNNQEWQEMAYYLSNQVQSLNGNASWSNLGENLKSTTGWASDNGDNLYNFNAYPAGIRTASGTNLYLGDQAYFWSASDSSATDAYFHQLNDSTSNFIRGFQGDKNDLYSCRCLKN